MKKSQLIALAKEQKHQSRKSQTLHKAIAIISAVLKTIRPFIKPFLIVLAIYCFAMLAIWRANISFVDDIGRAVDGYAWNSDFNRYSASILSYVLNVKLKLADISPLPQIIAMVFLSISSVIVTYIFCNRKIKYPPLVLSTLIGLMPFIVECWLYKFDSVHIAFSILVSIIPFLFFSRLQKRDAKTWAIAGIVSLVCLTIMWTSFQASSGVYLVMLLALTLNCFLQKASVKTTAVRAAFYLAIYFVSAAIFKFGFPAPAGYRGTLMLDALNLFPGVATNVQDMIGSLVPMAGVWWGVIILVILLCFATSLLIYSQRKKWLRLLDLCAGSIFIFAAIPISYGAYLLLQAPPTNGRTFMGIGLILAITGIITCRNIQKIHWSILLIAPSLVLLWSSVVFTFGLGNGLADQERYGDYRVQTLLTDLSHLYPSHQEVAKGSIQIQGSIGMSPVLRHLDSQYPIVSSIVTHQQYGLTDYAWGMRKLIIYYNRYQNFQGVWDGAWDCSSWDVKLDTFYHSIKESAGGNVCVIVK